MKSLLKDKRNIIIALLVFLFLIKTLQADVRFIFWIAAGAGLCGVLDFLVNKIFLRKNIIPKSAIITGLILAGILDYREPLFVLIIFSFVAILSKHILKLKKKHLFNPAGLALFIAAIFKLPLTWNMESNIYLIICVGLLLSFSLKKIPHVLGFLIFFAVLFVMEGVNPINFISWFFLFIMLIEPKTSGYGHLRGFVFGSIAGITSFLIFKFLPQLDIFIGSLFVANLSNPILERIRR